MAKKYAVTVRLDVMLHAVVETEIEGGDLDETVMALVEDRVHQILCKADQQLEYASGTMYSDIQDRNMYVTGAVTLDTTNMPLEVEGLIDEEGNWKMFEFEEVSDD